MRSIWEIVHDDDCFLVPPGLSYSAEAASSVQKKGKESVEKWNEVGKEHETSAKVGEFLKTHPCNRKPSSAPQSLPPYLLQHRLSNASLIKLTYAYVAAGISLAIGDEKRSGLLEQHIEEARCAVGRN